MRFTELNTMQINMKTSSSRLLVSALLITFSLAASAQQYVYPAKEQTPEQQSKDEAECGTWATQQTGFDPSKPPPAPAPAPTKTRSGGLVKGAAVGATVGAITDNDVGNAAATGAVVGGVARHAKNKGAQQQAAANQQQINDQQQALQQNHQKARVACLEGRGYSIK
jgi:hypothetical protein